MTSITEETLSVSGVLLSKAFGRQRFEAKALALILALQLFGEAAGGGFVGGG